MSQPADVLGPPSAVLAADIRWMTRAIEVAALGKGRTAPNPAVGAVVVRDGQSLAEGHTQPLGQAHAEVHALGQLSEGAARGATMYVTLEPCCHHGRTPPCTDAILAAGIERVVVALVDPDERMQGRGLQILRRAGVEVVVGVCGAEAEALHAPYLRVRLQGRPFVVLKAAISLDGRIADRDGASKWITGPEARAAGHRLRDQADAILVGRGTLVADDPSLSTRIPGGQDAVPVVLDSQLRCPPDARVLVAGRKPILFCGHAAPQRTLPAHIERVGQREGGLDLQEVLSRLVDRGFNSLLVEGGGQVHRALLDAGFVDELHLFVAGKVLGQGPGWVGGPGYALADAPRFRLIQAGPVGDDLYLVYQRT